MTLLSASPKPTPLRAKNYPSALQGAARSLSFLLFAVIFLFAGVTQTALADDRVNPIENPIDTGSDYPLLTNEIPGMVIVLTFQQIQARGYRSLYDILRDLPGFSTRGGYGQGWVNLTMDGDLSQNNEKFLLFVDGVREQDLWRRSTWLSYQYPVYFIKNITIFYGPAATRFGANAVSGVIFIDTKKAEDLADGYGEVTLNKDIRNNAWTVNFMLGHSYTKRTHPKLAKNLFSWYFRGRFHYGKETSANFDKLWDTSFWTNPPGQYSESAILLQSRVFLRNAVDQYRDDYYRAYKSAFGGNKKHPDLEKAVAAYQSRLLNAYLNDPANSGLYANPKFVNENLTFSGEAGLRFDNWFLRFYLWTTGAGQGLRYLPHYAQTNNKWWIRNLSLSLHHLKSELWSSGVGEKATIIYFNLSLVYQRHEIPGSSSFVNFIPESQIFRGSINVGGKSFAPKCLDVEGGQNEIACTWRDYSWHPTYYYVLSNSFRVEPKFDFRLLSGRLKMSLGVNTGGSLIQGPPANSSRPDPEKYANPASEVGAGNQYEHLYFTAFLQSEVKMASFLSASVGLRSDWETVRGELEVVPNCDRTGKCYRYSAPLVGRASLISKLLKNKLQIRLSYGYAFLSPSNWELYGNAAGENVMTSPRSTLDKVLDARELLPQDKHSVELNAYANIKDKVFFTASVFHHWLSNITSLVVLPFRQNETRNINIGNQRTLGIRFYSVIKLFKWMSLGANFAVLFPRLYAFNLQNEGLNPIKLGEIPTFQGNLIADFRSAPHDLSHFFGSFRVNLVSGRKATTFNQLQNGTLQLDTRTPESGTYVLLHLSAGYLWRPPENMPFLKHISVSAAVENLLNTNYYDLGIRTALGPIYTPLVPQPGINAAFNLSVGF